MTIAFTHDTLMAELERESGILLLDFWASWCAPCRAFAPTYDKVAKLNPDLTFGKVDTEVERQLASAFAIRSIPTLMVFRDGVLLFAQPGALPEAALSDLVAKVRALDMNEVREKIAEAEAARPDAAKT